ncbi:sensor histidine kinase [Cellulomonas denverensis]|uniref:histidine kinase n=1 Tax=Cellulomonas denverensis TaxID=264297 RepID=A0A7X6QZJ2_9CELL|nr:histidine kinase [Cellulomonas denverensis]NKY23319.1 sensor histidine kinase [Cellulomonas denverensis]GIG24392.1 histidine kinase [Cellulomonas denverensis]
MDDGLGAALRGGPRDYLRSSWPWRAWGWCAQAGVAGGIVYGLGAAVVVPVASGTWRLTTIGGVLLEALMLLLFTVTAMLIGAWQRQLARVGRSTVLSRYPLPPGPAAATGRRLSRALRAPFRRGALVRDLIYAVAFLPLAAAAALAALIPPFSVLAGLAGIGQLLASGRIESGPDLADVAGVAGAAVVTLGAPWIWGWLALAGYRLAEGVMGVGATRAAEREQAWRASRRRLSSAFEAERRRIERDLHDGPQQRILAQMLTLGLAADELRALGEPAAGALDLVERARRENGAVLAELRDLVRAIHPQVLTDRGLAAALAEVLSRFPLRVESRLEYPQQNRPDPLVESTAYFVVLEALSNAVKHARCRSVELDVRLTDDVLHLLVVDDGIGGATVRPEGGLAGLADRVAAVAGRLRIDSPPGGPTVLRADIPCQPRLIPPGRQLEDIDG